MKSSWAFLEPGVPFQDNWHILAFCNHVQWMLEGWLVAHGKGTRSMRQRVLESWALHGMDYAEGELLVQNMIWNLAPGTLKSRILMVVAPAWMWLWDPTWSVGALSGNEDNVKRDSNAHRDLVTSPWYRGTFGVTWRIRRDVDGVSNWRTTAGGIRKSKSIGQNIVGTHVDCVAGETMVATEVGDVAISALHEMHVADRPLVWSMNHATGRLELRRIRATRKIDDRPVVRVRVSSGAMIRCTGDHKIYADGDYVSASESAGRQVSMLRRTEQAVELRQTTPLLEMQDDNLDLRDVPRGVPARRSRAREARAIGDQVRPILLAGTMKGTGNPNYSGTALPYNSGLLASTVEPDHAMRRLSQPTAQIELSTVDLVEAVAVDGRQEADAVYDLDVDGNHNFFAGGILVHNCILLDDPDDADRVWNESARRSVQDRWTRAHKNRVKDLDRSLRIAIQQRVHVDDWTAAQVNKSQWSPDDRKAWAWIAVPVLFGHAPKEAPRFSPWGWCDPRRVANENMHPARFSDSALADEERDKGPEGLEAQYNQNPERLDGGLVKRSQVRFFRVEDQPVSTRPRPAGCGRKEDGSNEDAFVLGFRLGKLDLDCVTVTVDCSNGGERVVNSAVGILVVGVKGMQRFILDDKTDVMGIDAMYEAVAAACSEWPVEKAIIELKAAGASVINDMRKRLERGDIVGPDGRRAVIELVAYNPGSDSKDSRAVVMANAFRAGLVYVLDGADWLYAKTSDSGKTIDQGFVGEICTFPRSKRNDRVDALAQLIAYYLDAVDVKSSWAALSRM